MKFNLNWILLILAFICFVMSAFIGWNILKTEAEYHAGIEAYEQLAFEAGLTEKKEPGEFPAPLNSIIEKMIISDQTEDSAVPSDDNDRSPASEESIDLPEINFKAIRRTNPNIIGWIYSPDSVINYPIVQGNDNDFYLTHLADGTENSSGSPFLDVQNDPDFTDENSIIYGHHMKNATMFASLTWYTDQDYYNEHPVMYLMTPSGNYLVELFSGYTTTLDSSAYMQAFSTKQEYASWLYEIGNKSDFKTNCEISVKDRILTLSTCAYNFENARYVLHGNLIKLK